MVEGHRAYTSLKIIKHRIIQKIIPNLGRKSNAQRNFSIAVVLLTILSMVGFGIYVDGYVIHPPKNYTGICPSPAHISDNDQRCTVGVLQTITKGPTTTTTVVQVPAGYVLVQNTTTVTVTK